MLLREVFVRKLFQRDRRDRRVGLVPLEGCVSDQRRNILFKLGQVLHDVVLCEVNSVVIVHFLSNTKEELAPLEHVNHDSYVLLDLLESLFSVLRLILVIGNLREQHVYLILERFLEIKLAHVGKLASLDDLLDLVLDLFV